MFDVTRCIKTSGRQQRNRLIANNYLGLYKVALPVVFTMLAFYTFAALLQHSYDLLGGERYSSRGKLCAQRSLGIGKTLLGREILLLERDIAIGHTINVIHKCLSSFSPANASIFGIIIILQFNSLVVGNILLV